MKKTNANYGARCNILKVDEDFVLKFELYSVKDEAILETFTLNSDDNSGEEYNALVSLSTTSGTTYFIRIQAISTTSGTYTFVVN